MVGFDRLFGFNTTQKDTLVKWLAAELAAAGVGGPIAISDVTGLQAALDALDSRVDALENP